jgi:manganese/iron transport system substrate-binding protein
MKSILLISFTALAVLFSMPAGDRVGSASAQTTADPRIKVVAVETFLADIVRNIAGDRLKVAPLLPVGADPHSFEPTPADVRKVADCNVLVVNGAGLEGFLEKMLENAGGAHGVVEASKGLAGRAMREGETAEMSDADLVKLLCGSVGKEQAREILSGNGAASAVRIPAENGLFEVSLAKQADGAYGGYLKYSTDETADFQLAYGDGLLKVLKAADSSVLKMERTVSLKCGLMARGNIVELVKGGEYIIALTGFKTEKTRLAVGPLRGHHHHQVDPHFWLDPERVVTYVKNVQKGLSEADPEGAAIYAARGDAYIAELNDLDNWIADQVKLIPPERRLLVTDHETLGYFADRYGFKIVGTLVASFSPEAAPSAKQLARIIKRIKATGAKAIFLESGTNPVLSRQVAQEAGIKVVSELYDHSLSGPEGPAPTYVAMMKYNTKAIVDALK